MLTGVSGSRYSIVWDGADAFVSVDDISIRFDVPVIGTALKDVEAWYGYEKGESFIVYGREGKSMIVHAEWGTEESVPAQRVKLE